jgi:hypothetical protein
MSVKGNEKWDLPSTIELLDVPIVTVEESSVIRTLVIERSTDEAIPSKAVGYIVTTSGQQPMLGEFSGEPLGTYAPVNAVIGFVGDGEVYRKQVTTDTPL